MMQLERMSQLPRVLDEGCHGVVWLETVPNGMTIPRLVISDYIYVHVYMCIY